MHVYSSYNDTMCAFSLSEALKNDDYKLYFSCDIKGSIISKNSIIHQKCELINCLVGPGQQLNTMGKVIQAFGGGTVNNSTQ